MNSLNIRPTKKSFLGNVGYLEIAFAAIAATTITIAVEGQLAVMGASLLAGIGISLAIVSGQTNWLKDSKLNRFLAREGVLPVIAVLAVAAFSMFMVLHPQPAMAQFFNNAQEKLTGAEGLGTFTTNAGDQDNLEKLINLIFVAYRFVIIIYIGTGLVKVIGAMREDEDWKAAAKMPALILICLTIADIASTLVLGT